MKHLRAFAKSAVAELPRAFLGRWSSVAVSLSVLTLFSSLAASQAFLLPARLSYAIHLLRDRPRIDFPPIRLLLALFCIGTVVSIAWSANPTAGWSVVRKVVLIVTLLRAASDGASTPC